MSNRKYNVNYNKIDEFEEDYYELEYGDGIDLYESIENVLPDTATMGVVKHEVVLGSWSSLKSAKLPHSWSESCFAFLMCKHPRVGAGSPARILTKDVLKLILYMCRNELCYVFGGVIAFPSFQGDWELNPVAPDDPRIIEGYERYESVPYAYCWNPYSGKFTR